MQHQIFELLRPSFQNYSSQQAIIFENESLSYSELGRRVDALAEQLKDTIPNEKLVGISCSRSIQTVVNLLAILSSGKTYLPIDFGLPKERLRTVVAQSGLHFFLPSLDTEDYGEIGLQSVFSIQNKGVEEPEVSEYAYVLFTSGSTGVPKGVCMPHRSLLNLVEWQGKNSQSTIGFNTLQFARLTFDVSFQEIFCTLSNGGTLFLISDFVLRDPHALLNYIIDNKINRVFLPFIALQGLVNTANAFKLYPLTLKEVITAGEQLKVNDSFKRFFSKIPACEFYNQYGPTESHVITQLQLKGDPNTWDELPTIGYPIQNTQVIIVSDTGKAIATPGEIGELYLAGDCLSDGYLNQLELSAEKFVLFSLDGQTSIRVYKSGDLGCWTENGEINFVGRKDDQVKINGFRVELGEIELAASKIDGIDECAVVTDLLSDSQLFVRLYYISGNTAVSPYYIREKLAAILPDYMIPAKIVELDEFPKTTSGKIDRKKLLQPAESNTPIVGKTINSPRPGLEASLASSWETLLPGEQLDREGNFFNLGGSSILAQKLSLAIKKKLDVHFPVAQIYQYPSIKAQAEYLSKNLQSSLKLEFTDYNPETNQRKDIAVIALSGKFPGADSTSEFWKLIKEEREGITYFNDEELDPLIHNDFRDTSYVKARGIVKDVEKFDASFFGMNPKIAAIMDPQQRLFLEISYEAMEKAGWISSRPDFKIGVFAGTNNNTYYTKNIVFNKEVTDVFGAIQVMSLNEKDYVATRTAFQLNLKGPAVSVHSACSTSLLAVAQAVQSIRSGQCDAALAGGSSVTFPVNSGQRYEEGAIFSKDGKCRPFDAQASGTTFSDGAGVVILKELSKAKADGDKILAVIKGVGVTNDGCDKASFSSPSVLGQADAVSTALKNAQVRPEQIGYIEAHGTATPIGDPIEIAALQHVFGSDLPKNSCAIGSVKSNVGHLTAASGIAGFIKTVYALNEKILPASLGFNHPNPLIDFENSPFYVQKETCPWQSEEKRIAGVSSFGIGGTNVHVVLEEYIPEQQATHDGNTSNYLAYYSAKSETSLSNYASKLLNYLDEYPQVNLTDLCATLSKRYHNYGLSQVLTFTDIHSFKEKIEKAAFGKYRITQAMGYFDYPVFMFPGQGSQYVGMGKSLYQTNAIFRQEFDRCCNGFNSYLPVTLQSVIFDDQDGNLSNTRFTQPALFAVSYAVAKMLQSMGINPAAFCGHSIGEYVAAHLAGVFSLDDVVKVIALRGKLISELPGGVMLSINAQVDLIRELLSDGLSIAAVNGPDLCVVAGEAHQIENFQVVLESHLIANHILATSHAFHSHMMENALQGFSAVVSSVKRNFPQIPILSTQTGNWITDAEAQSVEYWTNHIRNEVNFNAAFNRFTEELPQAFFIEVGPGNVLNTLGLHCKNGGNHPIANCLSKKNTADELGYLYEQLGILVAKGADINLKTKRLIDAKTAMDVPTYAFDKTTCWNQHGSQFNPEFSIDAVRPENNNLTNTQDSNKDNLIDEPMIDYNHFYKLQSIVEDASGIDLSENDLSLTFFELGLDSLVLTQLAFSINKAFGINVSFRQLNNSVNTPGAVLEYISSQGKKPQDHTPNDSFTPVPAVVADQPDAIQLLQQQLESLSQQFASLKLGGKINQPVPVATQVKGSLSPEQPEEESKPFGAIARIERSSYTLSLKSKRFLQIFQNEYNSKTQKSKFFAQENRKKMADPRVVTGFKPAIKELVYPIVTEKSKGAYITDIDGNQYLDWLNGFGSNIFGYSPEFIVKEVKKQLDNGYEIGPQHILSGEVANLLCELTGNERVAFCNTGSEAVLGAIRIARTVSSKPFIVSFTGSYHGITDEALVRTTKSGQTFPAAPGILSENVQQIILLEYGSSEALRVIKERANEIAGVLVEPVQSRRPEFVPVEFLKELRALTASENICLIFDEVITGFRAFPGGVQQGFGIRADLATYGKVVGGGMPIGVIGGKSHWMDALDGGFWQYGDDSMPPAGVTYFAGTFVRHPLALAAAKASLTELLRQGPDFQERLAALTNSMVTRMNEMFTKFNVPYYAVNYRSLWKIKSREEFPYWEMIFTLLRNEGIHIWENFPCFVTDAHQQQDVDFTLDKLEKVLIQLIENEIVIGDLLDLEETLMHSDNPPFTGAVIGLDKDGNPCWTKGA